MLSIAIPLVEIGQLTADGCRVRINFTPTVIRREGDYLCYYDGEQVNRCKILSQRRDGDLMHFFAASHGMDDEPHWIIGP